MAVGGRRQSPPPQLDVSMRLLFGVREGGQKSMRLGREPVNWVWDAARLGGWRRQLGSLGGTHHLAPWLPNEPQRGGKAPFLLLWAGASRPKPAQKGQILIGQRLSQSDAPIPRTGHVTWFWPMPSERTSVGGADGKYLTGS